MDIDGFWSLIEKSRDETDHLRSRTDWLTSALARMEAPEIVDFQVFLDRTRKRVDTYDMWEAANLIFDGGCSTDSFWYFQVWLVGLGRKAFEHAAADPDDLADLAEVTRLAGRPLRDWSEEDEWPEWESLSYVARSAFDQVVGTDEGIYDALELRGHQSPYDPDPTGAPWEHRDSQVGLQLPNLSRLFPGAAERGSVAGPARRQQAFGTGPRSRRTGMTVRPRAPCVMRGLHKAVCR